jgi:hypothetical protein
VSSKGGALLVGEDGERLLLYRVFAEEVSMSKEKPTDDPRQHTDWKAGKTI